MSKVTHIAVHHTVTKRAETVPTIRKFHIEGRGWRDIGYHRLISQPNSSAPVRVYQGRQEDGDLDWEPYEFGAHVKGANSSSISVSLIGNFSEEPLPPAMFAALVDECASLCRRFGLSADRVLGHREFPEQATECPGLKVDMGAVRVAVLGRLSGSAYRSKGGK